MLDFPLMALLRNSATASRQKLSCTKLNRKEEDEAGAESHRNCTWRVCAGSCHPCFLTMSPPPSSHPLSPSLLSLFLTGRGEKGERFPQYAACFLESRGRSSSRVKTGLPFLSPHLFPNFLAVPFYRARLSCRFRAGLLR
jgi:hypothetical protein